MLDAIIVVRSQSHNLFKGPFVGDAVAQMVHFVGWQLHIDLDSQILLILCVAIPSFVGLSTVLEVIIDLKGILNTDAVP